MCLIILIPNCNISVHTFSVYVSNSMCCVTCGLKCINPIATCTLHSLMLKPGGLNVRVYPQQKQYIAVILLQYEFVAKPSIF